MPRFRAALPRSSRTTAILESVYTTSGHKWCRDQDSPGHKECDFNPRPRTNTADSDHEKSDEGEPGMSQQEQDLEKKIKKEIDKLKFYIEESDELLED